MPRTTISVLVADSHDIVRAGLCSLLERQAGIHVVGEAATAEAAMDCIVSCRPHLAIVAADLPQRGGLGACRAIRTLAPDTRVLVIGEPADSTDPLAAITAGAGGYLLTTSDAERLYVAVRAVADGETFLDPAVAGSALEQIVSSNVQPIRHDPLSGRELEVLALLAAGYTNRRIAQQLSVSETTVKTHVSHIFDKMRVERRVDATRQAVLLGLDRIV